MSRRLLPYGDSARLLECHDLEDSQRMLRWLDQQEWPQVAGIVPGARTLLLHLSAPLPADLTRSMITMEPPPVPQTGVGQVIIDVRYDGPDLDEVADQLEMDVEELIDYHTGQDWTVAFSGFSPGFGYLAPTERELRVPRRDSPRTKVPAGSVALADQWSAVYPTASPGGWQLIGTTDAVLFDVRADPPAVLAPGTPIRFRRRDT